MFLALASSGRRRRMPQRPPVTYWTHRKNTLPNPTIIQKVNPVRYGRRTARIRADCCPGVSPGLPMYTAAARIA